MKTKEVQQLIEYLGREQACYTSLLDLSRKQYALIDNGDIDSLMAVLGQKQQILGRVAEVESKIRPYKDRWDSLRSTLTADDREMLDLALGSVEELLAELIKLEQDCEQLLQGQIHGVRQELDSATVARGVQQTYAPGRSKPTSGLLDLSDT